MEKLSIFVKIVRKVRRFFSRRKSVYLVKLAIATLVMTVLVIKIEPSRIAATFRSAGPGYFVLAFCLLAPNLYLQFFKWRYLLRLEKPDVTGFEVLSSLFAGFTFGLITPGRIGEFGRVFLIKGKPWVTLLGLSAIDKFFSLAVVFAGGTLGLSLLLFDRLKQYFLYWAIVVFAGLTVLVLLFLLLHPDAIRTLLYSLNIQLPVREKIKQLIASLDNFHKKQALHLLCLSGLFYLVFIAQFYLLVLAFEKLAVWKAFEAIAATLLVKTLLPITLGDLGIREGAAIEFFSYLQIENTTAFNASVMLFVINVLLPSLIGLFFVLRNRLGNNSLTQKNK